jgi:ligand-binding SRPBCC domain-containing protein
MSDSTIHIFDGQIDLPISREEAWGFFATPLNLSKVTPPSFALKLDSDQQLLREMYPGQVIVYRMALFMGFSMAWVTEITQINCLNYFVDDQRVGPFRLWHHEHHFQEIPGGTRVRDIVHYKLPLGIVGDLFGAWIVKRQVNNLFAYRRDVLIRRFGRL